MDEPFDRPRDDPTALGVSRDVTDRRAADARFRGLLESAPDAILLVDGGGKIVLANRRAGELFGWGAEGVAGTTVEDLVPERFRGMHVRHRAGYAADPRTREMGAGLDLYGRRRDGSEFPVEISLSPLEAEGEELVVTIVRDVTDRKALEGERLELARAQAAQLEAEAAAARLAVLQDVTEEALVHVSLDDLLEAVLEKVCAGMGAAAGAVLLADDDRHDVLVVRACVGLREERGATVPVGEGIAGRVAAESRALVFDDVAQAWSAPLRESGMRSLVGAPLVLGGDVIGVLHVASSEPCAFGDEDAQLLQILADRLVLAVSQARLFDAERAALEVAEASRRDAESARERLREIVGDLEAIVWEAATPTRERFSFVSGRAEDFLGYPRERWQDDDGFWSSIVHPEDRDLALAYFRETGAKQDLHEFEYRVIAADGRLVRVRDIVRAVRDHGGGVRLRGMMIDVSERRDLEARLLQAQKMEAVGQLAGGVAHDFNNLLTVILGYAQLLLRRAADQQTRAQLGELVEAAERGSYLTRQLLAFSRRGVQRRELLDLNRVVANMETILERSIGEDVALSLSLEADLDRVEADPGHLEQVLLNLVINARDAMPGGGEVRVETRAADFDDEAAGAWALPPGRYVLVVVADTGSGMAPEVTQRMFEPFFTTKEPGKGSGLGLATVYGIVQEAGGAIRVESEPGRGTDFAVALPSAGQAAADEVEDAEEPPVATILLVEDEPALRALARSILVDERYEVIEAANGRDALRVAEQFGGRIDLLLTDVVMPKLSGPELAEALRALRPETSVLYMSGYADSRLAFRGVSATQVNMVRKPFRPDDLVDRVQEALVDSKGA